MGASWKSGEAEKQKEAVATPCVVNSLYIVAEGTGAQRRTPSSDG
jgi:hypothetical protein